MRAIGLLAFVLLPGCFSGAARRIDYRRDLRPDDLLAFRGAVEENPDRRTLEWSWFSVPVVPFLHGHTTVERQDEEFVASRGRGVAAGLLVVGDRSFYDAEGRLLRHRRGFGFLGGILFRIGFGRRFAGDRALRQNDGAFLLGLFAWRAESGRPVQLRFLWMPWMGGAAPERERPDL